MGNGAADGDELKKGIDVDEILVDEVGQFGKYQVVMLLLAAAPIIFAAWASGEYIFTTARISTRCLISQCESEPPVFVASWLSNAIPPAAAEPGTFHSCLRYPNSSEPMQLPNDVCPRSWFDHTRTEQCDSFVYENTYSVVYDFGLACDEWRRSQIGSIRNVGTLLVLPITGFISDRWGRRVALIINALNTGWIGLARSFVDSYEWFLALEVVEATLGAGAFSTCYVLVTELVGPKYRVIAGTTMSTCFALGQVLLGFIAWGVPQWRSLTRALYAPQLLVIAYFWILSESVRWLMSKGRYAEAEVVLEKAADMNGKKLSEKSMQRLRATAEVEKSAPRPKEEWLPAMIVKSKRMLLRCCVSPIWWITTTFVYYGMGINAVNLSGNRYLNYVAVAAVDIPGYWTAILLLDRVGRKPVLIMFYWLCAACQFGFAFTPDNNAEVRLALYLLGKCSIAIVMTSIYIYTAEIYPTRHRHTLLAFSSMIGRLGAITAPLTPALEHTVWASLPSVLFGSFALLSGALVFTSPETLGTKLPDTMEEAEQLGHGTKK